MELSPIKPRFLLHMHNRVNGKHVHYTAKLNKLMDVKKVLDRVAKRVPFYVLYKKVNNSWKLISSKRDKI